MLRTACATALASVSLCRGSNIMIPDDELSREIFSALIVFIEAALVSEVVNAVVIMRLNGF